MILQTNIKHSLATLLIFKRAAASSSIDITEVDLGRCGYHSYIACSCHISLLYISDEHLVFII